MSAREELHAYVTWLETKWLPAIAAGEVPPTRDESPRPKLTVIRGGLDENGGEA